MATTINAYSVSLGLDASNYINNSNVARGETQRLRREIDQARTPAERYALATDRLADSFKRGVIDAGTYNRLLENQKQKLQAATVQTNTFASSLGRAALAYVSFRSAGAIIGGGIELAAEAEQAQIAFKVLTKDAATAKDLLSEIKKFAAVTPFQFGDLRDAGRMLLAFKFSAQEVVPAIAMLGNIAAATNQPIGELAELIGRARVQGTIYSEDLNQLTGRGINVLDGLAERFGTTTDQVKKLASEAKISYEDVYAVLQDLSSNEFGGMISEQSETLNGSFSTLKDNLAEIQTILGETFIPTLKKMSEFGIEFAKDMKIALGVVTELFDPDTGNGLSGSDNRKIWSIEDDLKKQDEFLKMQMADPAAAIKRSQAHMERINEQKAIEAEKKRLELLEKQSKIKEKGMTDSEVNAVVKEHEAFLHQMDTQRQMNESEMAKALENARRFFDDERNKSMATRSAVAKGPGSGMSVGSAEAARFQAEQVNKALAVAAVPVKPSPGEQQLLDEARRQFDLIKQQADDNKAQVGLLQKLLENAQQNGFKRI